MRAHLAPLAPLVVLFVSLGCSGSDDDGSPGGSSAGSSPGGSSAGAAVTSGGASAGTMGLSGNPSITGGTGGAAVTSGGSSGASGGSSVAGSSNSAGTAGAGGTGGSGTGPGIPCTEPFEAVDSDLKGCIADVAGVTMKFFPLAPNKPVKRVAVFLHGDTAQDWYGWYQFLGETVEWCKERDILVVAPLCPIAYEDDPPDERSYGAAQDTEAEQVAKALEDFLDAYDTPHQGLLYWTLSGGSWFVTSSFLPMMGARLPGSYALSCGASDFWRDYEWSVDGPAKAQNKLLFNYGTEDFLLEGEEASAEKFKDDGFSVSVKTYPGAEHCDHPVHEPTIEFWSQSL